MNSFNEWDASIVVRLQEMMCFDGLTPWVKLITYTSELGILSIIIFVILVIRKDTRRAGILLGLSIFITLIICTFVIKPLVLRTRPYEICENVLRMIALPHDSSFPSGHTSNSFAWAFSLYYSSREKSKFRIIDSERIAKLINNCSKFAIILAFMVGLSRIYLGVHYLSDVIAGALLGLIISLVVYRFAPRLFQSNFYRSVFK